MMKYIIWSYLPLFTISYPYLSRLAIFVTIFVIIYSYLAKYTLIWPYLPLYLAIFAYAYLIRSSPLLTIFSLLWLSTHIMCSYIEALCNLKITFGVIAFLRMVIQKVSV